jgi:rhombotail lipoprotein
MIRHLPRLAVFTVFVLLLAGCIHFNNPRKSDRSSSVVDFLYPGRGELTVEPSIPELKLPLRVGLAFLPSPRQQRQALTEAQKSLLLQKVADRFRQEKFVRDIQVIPTLYLREKGGFDNLDQLQHLLGIDVVVLVAYDQVQFTDENMLSLSYWTIVGAYIFHGNRNDTSTLMEAVVYDIPSRSLLFRAPGIDQTHSSSTAIKTGERQREDGVHSVDLAIADLIKNLDTELTSFRQRVREGTAKVKITHREGYTGGGSLSLPFVLALAGLGLTYQLRRRRQ